MVNKYFNFMIANQNRSSSEKHMSWKIAVSVRNNKWNFICKYDERIRVPQKKRTAQSVWPRTNERVIINANLTPVKKAIFSIRVFASVTFFETNLFPCNRFGERFLAQRQIQWEKAVKLAETHKLADVASLLEKKAASLLDAKLGECAWECL